MELVQLGQQGLSQPAGQPRLSGTSQAQKRYHITCNPFELELLWIKHGTFGLSTCA